MLIHDRRPGNGEPARPGLHALVIGISRYRHLPRGGGPPAVLAGLEGLEQLPTSARTAADVAGWLLQQAADDTLSVPLQTLRVLLAPSEQEQEQGLPPGGPATYDSIRQAVNDWRADARRHRNGMALFFYSGHGVGGTLEDSILLPEDFADPAVADPLLRVVSHTDLRGGMRPPAHPLETVAQWQLYFWDSCRNRPSAFRGMDWSSLPTVWDDDSAGSGEAYRELAEVMATVPEQRAFAGRPGGRTLFGHALLECLEGAAAMVALAPGGYRWRVLTTSIIDNLQTRMDAGNRALRTQQKFLAGRMMPIPIVAWPTPPQVRVQLNVRPPEQAQLVGLTMNYVFDPPDEREVFPVHPIPYTLDLPMGFYRIKVRNGGSSPFELRPPRFQAVVVDGGVVLDD